MTGFGNVEETHAGKLLSLLKSATPPIKVAAAVAEDQIKATNRHCCLRPVEHLTRFASIHNESLKEASQNTFQSALTSDQYLPAAPSVQETYGRHRRPQRRTGRVCAVEWESGLQRPKRVLRPTRDEACIYSATSGGIPAKNIALNSSTSTPCDTADVAILNAVHHR